MKKITVAVPFLNEEENLVNYHTRIMELREALKDYIVEFLFIDDGSEDSSFLIVKKLSKEYENIKILKLSKNYGSHYAVFSAIDNSHDCDYFCCMSSDLQEPVSLYVDLVKKIEANDDTDIVFAERQNRNTETINRFFSKIYNKLVKKFAIKDFPEKGVDMFIFNKSVLQALQNMNIKNTSLYGNMFNLGFNREFVSYSQLERNEGESKWTLTKKIKLVLDTFISFSLVPLRLISIIGFIFFFIGLFYGIFIIVAYYLGAVEIEGWATIIALNTFGFGVLFLMLGVVSEYIWRIYDQLNPNKSYVIKEKIGFDK